MFNFNVELLNFIYFLKGDESFNLWFEDGIKNLKAIIP
jgi:hypothetical protein